MAAPPTTVGRAPRPNRTPVASLMARLNPGRCREDDVCLDSSRRGHERHKQVRVPVRSQVKLGPAAEHVLWPIPGIVVEERPNTGEAVLEAGNAGGLGCVFAFVRVVASTDPQRNPV